MDEKTKIEKMKKNNYLPKQYSNDSKLKINHNYLKEQFSTIKKF